MHLGHFPLSLQADRKLVAMLDSVVTGVSPLGTMAIDT